MIPNKASLLELIPRCPVCDDRPISVLLSQFESSKTSYIKFYCDAAIEWQSGVGIHKGCWQMTHPCPKPMKDKLNDTDNESTNT